MENKISEFSDKCVIFKISSKRIRDKGIYGAVRWAWHANLNRVRNADYVLAVEIGTGGRVVGIFKPILWYKATSENDKKYEHFLNAGGTEENEKRIAFKGVEVNDELLKRKYKYIPKELLGQANPVRYLNC